MSVYLWCKFDVELEASEILMTPANVKYSVQQVCISGTNVQIQVMYMYVLKRPSSMICMLELNLCRKT